MDFNYDKIFGFIFLSKRFNHIFRQRIHSVHMNALHVNTWILVWNKNGPLLFVCRPPCSSSWHPDRMCLLDWKPFRFPPLESGFILVLLHHFVVFTADKVSKLLFLSYGCCSDTSSFSISLVIPPSCLPPTLLQRLPSTPIFSFHSIFFSNFSFFIWMNFLTSMSPVSILHWIYFDLFVLFSEPMAAEDLQQVWA